MRSIGFFAMRDGTGPLVHLTRQEFGEARI